MKKTIITLLLLIPIIAQAGVIKGKLNGRFGGGIPVVSVDYGNGLKTAKINAGEFQVELTVPEAQFVILNISKIPIYIYLTPDKEVELDITADYGSEVSYTIKNKKDYSNIIISELNDEIKKIDFPYFGDVLKYKIGNLPTSDVEAFKTKYEKQIENLKKSEPNFKQDLELSLNSLIGIIEAQNASPENVLERLQAIKNIQYGDRVYTIPYVSKYLELLANMRAADELKFYGFNYDTQKDKDKISKTVARVIVNYTPSQLLKGRVFTEMLNTELMVGQAKHEDYVDYLIANLDTTKVKPLLDKYYAARNKKYAAAKELPDAFNFEFEDCNGKKFTLNDFKGKMIMIDCWASWCAPCRGQIPHLRALEHEYKDMDIVFISVSLDNTKEAWLKGVEEEKLEGYVLYAPGAFKNPFPKFYGIASIPRFLLIDANGKMINNDMPKPQDMKGCKAIIDQHLYSAKADKLINEHLDKIKYAEVKDKMIRFKAVSNIVGIQQNITGSTNFKGDGEQTSVTETSDQMRIMLGEKFYLPAKTILSMSKGLKFVGNRSMKDDNLFLCPEGFELAFLKERGLRFNLDGTSLDANKEDYVFETHDIKRDIYYKIYINKNTLLISKFVQDYVNDRASGGGRFEVTLNYTKYDKAGEYYYVKEMNTMGMIKKNIISVEFMDNNPSLFEIK